MTDKVRIGIIGVGQIGKHHVQRYKEIPEAEIVAICDIRADEAQRVAATIGSPTIYADYRDLLARDDIQSVDVCLHNHLHAPVTIAALEAGKNVYCEKPMSWNYTAAKSMLAAAQRTGRKLHIQLATIYAPEARAAKRLIDEGQLGQIYYAKSSHYRRRGRPWVDGYGTQFFVQKAAAGGGALVDMAVYHIARMMWLLGNPAVETVSGKTYQMLDNIYPDRRASAPTAWRSSAWGWCGWRAASPTSSKRRGRSRPTNRMATGSSARTPGCGWTRSAISPPSRTSRWTRPST